MAFSHIFADQSLWVRQPRDNIAFAIGNQDRGCRRQASLLEVLGKPAQVETGKYDAGRLSGAAIELQSEVDQR